jgi:hypothetical protein
VYGLRALVLILFIFAAVSAIGVGQSDDREVVQASEILEKIERGEPVNYVDKIVAGDLILSNLELREAATTGSSYETWDIPKLVIYSRIDLQRCTILGALDFSNAIMQERVSFNDSTMLAESNFLGSEFNQNACFIRARFDQNANFAGAQFNQSADFSKTQFREYADFSEARFDKDAIFLWSTINSADFSQTTISGDLSLKGSKIYSLDLKDAEIGEIELRSWKSIGHMEYDETAYLLILSNLRNQNLLEDANACYYDYRSERRATLDWPYNWADLILNRFYGYGVKPERPVIWAFVFMAIFAALFWWRQGIMPVRQGEPEEEAARFTLPEAAAFSAMTFLSGGKLVFDPPEYRIAPGKPWRDVQICKALFVWERLMGMILIVMFAIAVSKTIILGS